MPGGADTIAWDINNRGQVVGYSQTLSGKADAFLWEDEEMVDLGTLPNGDDFSWALGINNRGQVVGQSQTASGSLHAVLWSK